MGRHSRKSAASAPESAPVAAPSSARPTAQPDPFAPGDPFAYDDVFANGDPFAGWPEPTVTHQGYAQQDPPSAARPAGHPQQYEPGGAWGARPDSVYGDWHGVPRPRPAEEPAPRSAAPSAPRDSDTPAFGTPAVGFPQVTLAPQAPVPDFDAFTSTGSHRRVPGPRRPADAGPGPVPAATGTTAAAAEPVAPAEDRPAAGRGKKALTYTGMAAAAVTTVLAVVVAGQTFLDGDDTDARAGAPAATGKERSDSAASRSEGRPTPNGAVAAPLPSASAPAPAPELTYEQQMALQMPIDAKLAGPGTFDTVPGVAKAPGKGKVVRYRVDVEQGLGLDAQLFAEAVHRTLNDDRSWGHGGSRTFERVPGGESDFVITLASPGTTGVWCAKSDLDTTVDNVSCDSASTERVMINAFRWAQGSATYGPEQMFAYRQMLINHEVGHRLGHGHVNCRTPGALAPIMQQQTKSLDINGIQCKPNPWAFPGN